MAQHLAAWRSARPTTDSGGSTVWTEARKARLVQLLSDAEYDISQKALAEALGVSPISVMRQMRQPSMAEHYAAWRGARGRAAGPATLDRDAEGPSGDALAQARLVAALREREYD
eukprot:scaffold1610_cov492-Prasinococcus_capsulatus_cf.AAC.1